MQQFSVRKYGQLAFAAGLFLSGVLLIVWHFWWSSPTVEPNPPSAALGVDDQSGWGEPAIKSAPTQVATIVVYVSGAVRMPEVYSLPASARVKDGLIAAGGLTTDAELGDLNLADRLRDGQHLHIARQGETNPAPGAVDLGQPEQAGELLDVNQASETELENLPGVGQAIAARIVAYRQEHGPFATVEDLRNVKGIGASLFAQIAPLVVVK